MANPFDDRIDAWAADYAEAPESAPFSRAERDAAREPLVLFLRAATASGVDPGDLGRSEVEAGLAALDGANVDPVIGTALYGIVESFLVMLGRQGRIADARELAAFVRTRASSRGSSARPEPIRRGYSKLGPNEPCPCGSGKKWKKCCRKELEGY